MTAPLHQGLLRFWAPGGAHAVGTGFLVRGIDDQVYALTCAHVVNDALGLPKTSTVKPPDGMRLPAELARLRTAPKLLLPLLAWFPPPANPAAARSDPVTDIAVLGPVDGFDGVPCPPLRLTPPERSVGSEFQAFGFMQGDEGTPAQGRVAAVDAAEWLVVTAAEATGQFIGGGLSGAPAIAAPQGDIIGMVSMRFEEAARQGGVIPGFVLARAWPLLARPYVGLRPFDADTAHLFFGRGRRAQPHEPDRGMIRLLRQKLGYGGRVIALVGASGSGKSSLLRAGLLPSLMADGWATILFRPEDRPLANLADAIARAIAPEFTGTPHGLALADQWSDRLRADPQSLRDALATLTQRGARHLVWAIDQFEEFFGADEDGADTLATTRRTLLPALRDTLQRGASILLTLRADLMETVLSDRDGATFLRDTVALGAMTPPELMEAVEGPARLFGACVDRDFLERMIADAAREAGRLPLLQVILEREWPRLTQRGGTWVMGAASPTGTAEKSSSPLETGFAAFAEEATRRLMEDPLAPMPEAVIRGTLLALVRFAGRAGSETPVRRPLRRSQAPREWPVLERLTKERIVAIAGEAGTEDAIADLAHETLLLHWPRLAGWVVEDRDFLRWRTRLEAQLASWLEDGRAEDRVLAKRDCLEAERFHNSHGDRLTEEETAFVEASAARWRREEEEKEQRRQLELIQTQTMLQLQRQEAEKQAELVRLGQERIVQQATILEQERAYAAKQELLGRVLTWSSLILLLFASIAAWFFFEAAAARDRAIEKERTAAAASVIASAERDRALLQESRAIATLARAEIERGDAMTALAALLEALPGPGPGRARPESVPAATTLLYTWLRNREVAALVGHRGAVTHAAWGPDGRVLTASLDGTARVWAAQPGGSWSATLLEGHRGEVWHAAWGPDGRVVTAGDDGAARVWTAQPGGTWAATLLEGHRRPVRHADWGPDGRVVTASDDGTARVWTPQPGGAWSAIVLEGHQGPVTHAAWGPDGRVVTAGNDGTARVWTAQPGGTWAATLLSGHQGPVLHAAWGPDGRVVTAGDDRTAVVWTRKPGGTWVAIALEGHRRPVRHAAWGPDGRVVTASDDGNARVWTAQPDGGWTATLLEGHRRPVRHAAWGPDGRVLTVADDSTARVWTPRPGGTWATTTLEGHRGAVHSAAWGPDGRVLTAGDDQTARVWISQPIGSWAATRLEGHRGSVRHAAWGPDGRVLTAGDDGTARVWTAQPGGGWAAAVLEGHRGSVMHAAWGPDGRVVTAGDDGIVRVWTPQHGGSWAATLLYGHLRQVRRAAWGPHGQVLAAGDDGTMRMWTAQPGGDWADTALEGHSGRVWHAAWGPDGRVLTAGDDGTARVWTAQPGGGWAAAVLEGHRGPVLHAAWGPDGRVLTAGLDGTARVWTPRPGGTWAATPLEGHRGQVRHAAWGSDGRALTAGDDGTARVWTAQPGGGWAAALLEGHRGPVLHAAWGPDGRVLTAGDDGTVRVWNIPRTTADLVALAQQSMTRGLTLSQREAFGLPVPAWQRDWPRERIPSRAEALQPP